VVFTISHSALVSMVTNKVFSVVVSGRLNTFQSILKALHACQTEQHQEIANRQWRRAGDEAGLATTVMSAAYSS